MGRHFTRFIAIFCALFILYHFVYMSDLLTSAFGITISRSQHFGIHLGGVLFLAYLLTPPRRGGQRNLPPWYDIILAFLSLTPTIYYSLFYDTRIFYARGELLPEHVLLGWLLVILTLEMLRRLIGWAMPSVVALLIVYASLGNHAPGFLFSRGFPLDWLGESFYLSKQGIFGIPLEISSTIIILFLFFSQILLATGAGEFVMKVAFAALGHIRGGPAKVSVVSSGLFGMFTGNVSANVAGTGVFTIPMMKKIGYKPEVAGAIESVASLGGGYMPPMLGEAVFIMSAMIGVPYVKIMIASIIPAILYYGALFIAVDLEAARTGLRGLPRAQLPPLIKTARAGFVYLIPLVVIVYLLMGPMFTPYKAVLWAIVALGLLTAFRKETRLGLKKLVDASDKAVRALLAVAVACAAAGIIVDVVALTGVGISLSQVLTGVAGGNLVLLLLLTAAASFVMGMGADPGSCYIFLAVLVGPALVMMGSPLIAAHYFIYWWGSMSMITPPVCIAAYVAAGIAGSNAMATGFQATRLGVAAYAVPFAFALSPALLLLGTPIEIALAVVTSIVGIAAFTIFAAGYLLTKVPWIQRIIFLGAGIMLLLPGATFHITGISVLAVAVFWHVASWRRGARPKGAKLLEA